MTIACLYSLTAFLKSDSVTSLLVIRLTKKFEQQKQAYKTYGSPDKASKDEV